MAETKEPELIDPPHAPEVFADWAEYFQLRDGVIRITFSAQRTNTAARPPIHRIVTIGRLVMPIAGVRGLYLGLQKFLKDHGIDAEQPQIEEGPRTLQ